MKVYHTPITPTAASDNGSTPGYSAENTLNPSIGKPFRSGSNAQLTYDFSPAQIIRAIAIYGINVETATIQTTYQGATTVGSTAVVGVDEMTRIGKSINRIYFEQYPNVSRIVISTPPAEIGAVHFFSGEIDTRWPSYASTATAKRAMRNIDMANGSSTQLYYSDHVRTEIRLAFTRIDDDGLEYPGRIEQLGHEGPIALDVVKNWWVCRSMEPEYSMNYVSRNIDTLSFVLKELL